MLLWAVCGMSACCLPEAAAAPSYRARVECDVTLVREIRMGTMAKSELERDVYFRIYFMPGLEDADMARHLKDMGVAPGRGTLALDGIRPAPDNPRMPDPASVRQAGARHAEWYRTAAQRWPGIKHAIAHGSFPVWMSRDGRDRGILHEDYYEAHAAVAEEWYAFLKENDASIPIWYSAQNEPHWQWGGEAFARYSTVVADRLRRAHPEVRVAGPCSAWPYPLGDWRRWRSFEKPFVDIAGGRMDAYDLHFYSKGYWAYVGLREGGEPDGRKQDHPSLFVTQRTGVETVWDYGRLEAYLDLMAAYHTRVWGGEPRPMIVSEFGRQGINYQFGPWENEFKPWLYMTTVIRMWLTFMDRPEVRLTVPFIVQNSGVHHAAQRGMSLFNRPGAPADLSLVPTRFNDFYRFFRDIQGERIPVEIASDRPDLARWLTVRAFRSGATLLLLIHNGAGYPDHPATVSIRPLLGTDADGQPIKVRDARIQRLRWEGAIPEPHDQPNPDGILRIETEGRSLDAWREIALQGEETCLIRLDLSAEPTVRRIVETTFLSPDVLLEVEPAQPLEVRVPARVGSRVSRVRLGLGLAREEGFPVNPRLEFNGRSLIPPDLSWTRGVANFHGVEWVDVPADAVGADNRVRLVFPEGVEGGHPRLVTARLVVTTEEED